MPEVLWLVLLLLPVAAASGWYVRDRRDAMDKERSAPADTDYLRGIHYLVNDESDQAIESLVHLLEVSSETFEIHLALGQLFRRRGEVDRALRVHENLIARPALGREHRNQARHELARDYLCAGVLDRAEQLFRELLDQDDYAARAMSGLLSIYEQEQDWTQAIEIARRLERKQGHSLRPVIAQYHCELAELARDEGRPEAMRRHLRRARSSYRHCVRASLLRGALAESSDDTRLAIRIYRQIVEQDSEFVSEVIAPLQRCHERRDDLQGYGVYLRELMRTTERVQPHVAHARLLHAAGRTDEAIAHLSRYLQRHTNWIGFHELLELTRAGTDGGLTGPLENLRQSLGHLMQSRSMYHCGHCGFSGRHLYWQCPGCRQWN